MKQFCDYCNQPLKKVGDVYVCPIHGRVLRDVEEEQDKEEKKSYIG